MSDLYRFEVLEDKPYGYVLHCFDEDTADLFQDFLAEKMDIETSLKFELDRVSFFFQPHFSISEITDLFLRFKDQDSGQS
jgi:hypothetical protein